MSDDTPQSTAEIAREYVRKWVCDGTDDEMKAAVDALVLILDGTREGLICGCCGIPWTEGLTCSQKYNGWEFPTCYPCIQSPNKETSDAKS